MDTTEEGAQWEGPILDCRDPKDTRRGIVYEVTQRRESEKWVYTAACRIGLDDFFDLPAPHPGWYATEEDARNACERHLQQRREQID